MAVPKTYKVETLTEFTKRTEALLGTAQKLNPAITSPTNWYRGHSSSINYRLLPSLYRHPTIKGAGQLRSLEAKMLWDFKRQGDLHINHSRGETDDVGKLLLLFVMQHHGVPTRLLDWTGNPYIALYFALSGATHGGDAKGPAAVWVLNPHAWNRKALEALTWGDSGPAPYDERRITTYLPRSQESSDDGVPRYPFPIALVGSVNTPRMMAQVGHFTLFNDDMRPMEIICDSDKFPRGSLVKLEIPTASIQPMLTSLIACGFTDYVAYPDLEGLAMELRRIHGFKT